MSRVWCWAAVGLLICAPPLSAGDGGQLTPDQLPPEVASRIRQGFDAEPLHARKEVEGDKSCYVVTAAYKGRVIEIYASPDGSATARRSDAFSMSGWLDMVAESTPFLLLAAVAGAVVRLLVRAARGRSLSVPAGWLSAWVGASCGLALVVFNLATVPREKDVPVLAALCAAWGAVAASTVEIVLLLMPSGAGERQPRGRWVAVCCAVAAASAALTIPLDVLRIEREDRHWKRLVLRTPAD